LAFSQCRPIFESGCYHGVLEGYLQSKPELKSEDVAVLCDRTIDTSASLFIKFQCVHGLGHGFTFYYQHDIYKALDWCDNLATDWDRRSCYGGVFMENIIFAQSPHGNTEGHQTFLKAEDPFYPCNAVDDKYGAECYMMSSAVILANNGYNIAAAFTTCLNAPSKFIPTCYQSMGRDISGYTLHNPQKSLELCSLGDIKYRNHCFFAVAKQLIDVQGLTEQAFGFCRLAPQDSKENCYVGIGEMVATLYTNLATRSSECAKAETGYAAICAKAAQVSTA
jgi:hypothetical protein